LKVLEISITFDSQSNENKNKMKKSNKNTTAKIQLPAHLQVLADRFNSNYKNIASDRAKNFSYTIQDVTPAGYGN